MQIVKAIDMVRRGIPIRRTAKDYGVPESTVRAKLSAGMDWNSMSRPGRPVPLAKQEEDRIVEWIINMAKAGFPVESQRLRTSVTHCLKSIGRANFFGTWPQMVEFFLETTSHNISQNPKRSFQAANICNRGQN